MYWCYDEQCLCCWRYLDLVSARWQGGLWGPVQQWLDKTKTVFSSPLTALWVAGVWPLLSNIKDPELQHLA